MGPLEIASSAFFCSRHADQGAWRALNNDDKAHVMACMRDAFAALASVELSEAAKHAGRPHRDGDELAEGLFRAVLRQIVEEGK